MYRIDIHNLTVIHTDTYGEEYDMNAAGEPCADVSDLLRFVDALMDAGAYDADTRDSLMRDIAFGTRY